MKCKHKKTCKYYQNNSETCLGHEDFNYCGYYRKSLFKPLLFILVFTLILSLNIVLINAVGTYPNVDSNMVLYYHFNNDSSVGENYTLANSNVFDYSGSGNNGTTQRNMTWNSIGGYLGDGAFNFNGSQYIKTDYSTDFNFTNQSGFTVMSWVKPKSLISGDGDIVERYIGQNGNRSWAFYINNNLLNFAGSVDGITVVTEIGTTIINNNSDWVHLTGVWNGSDLKVYVNGALDGGTGTALASLVESPNLELDIGRSRRGQYFNGSIDEVILYNRSLSNYEIWDLYHNYKGCINLSEENRIGGNTTLCSGTQNLLLGLTGLEIADYSEINGNNTKLRGNWSGGIEDIRLFYLSGKKGIKINNLNISNFSDPFYILNSNDIYINNIYMDTFYYNYLLKTNNTVFNNSIFDDFQIAGIYTTTSINIGINNLSILNSRFINGNLSYGLSLHWGNNYNLNNISCDKRCIYSVNSIKLNLSNSVIKNKIAESGGTIYTMYATNLSFSNIFNNQFINDTNGYTFWINGESKNNSMFNNIFYNVTNYAPIRFDNSSYNKIYGNNMTYVDKGILIDSNANNNEIYNNHIDYATMPFDAYETGIIVENSCYNNSIHDNNISNFGSYGIYIRRSHNTNLYNNYLDALPRSRMSEFNYADYGEARGTAIAIVELLKSWTGDLSNVESDNRTNKIASYNSTNVTIYNNTYGDNVEVYFMNRGGILRINNTDLDSLSWWYRSFQFEEWEDKTELWINNNFNNLTSKLIDRSIGIILQQNFRNINRANYSITKDYMYFKNINRTGFIPLFNLTLPLITFSNGTSIYNLGTNLEYNLSLSPNNYTYILENYNCSEALQSSTGYSCGREHSPIHINSVVQSGISTSYHIASNSTSLINVPIILTNITCSDLKSVTITPNSLTSYTTTNYTCLDETILINNANLTYSTSSNIITITYYTNQYYLPLCTGILGGFASFNPWIIIFLIIGILVLVSIIGIILFVVKGTEGSEVQTMSPNLDMNTLTIKLLFLSIFVVAILLIFSLIVIQSICSVS